MHPLTTLAKLNREAEEAAHLISAHSPAAPIPDGDGVTSAQVREQRAHAQETIARITDAAKG